MSGQPCAHLILSDLNGSTGGARVRIARCDEHSLPWAGIAVWVWSRRARPSRYCPCDGADRFVVATEQADLSRIPMADVVYGPCQNTVPGAAQIAGRLSRLPGYALISVSAGRHGILFRTRTQQVLLAAEQGGPLACGICLYPWLVAGHCLDELAKRLPASCSCRPLAAGGTP
jgi:hypothetical protein